MASDRSTVNCTVLLPFVLALVCGAPFWWDFTTVYRADLPVDSMSFNSKILPKRQFEIHIQPVATDSVDPDAIVTLLDNFKKGLLAHKTVTSRPGPVSARVRTKVVKLDASAFDPDNFAAADAALLNVVPTRNPNTLTLFLVVNRPKKGEPMVFGGQYRHFWADSDITVDQFASVLDLTVFRKSGRAQREESSMKRVPIAARYHLCFSLVNEDPSLTQVQWDFVRDAMPVLQPIVDTLQTVADIVVTSQVLNFARITQLPSWDEKRRYFALPVSKLDSFVQANEWNLVATATSTDPTLQFVTFIPSMQHSPMNIVDDSQTPVRGNAFASARWGGVRIHNAPLPPELENNDDAELPTGQTYNMSKPELVSAIEVFVGQLRDLLGVHEQFFGEKLNTATGTSYVLLPPVGGVALWELDILLASRTRELVRGTGKNLGSLGSLINSLPNIVVLDRIRDQVTRSLAAVQDAVRAMADGHLVAAHESALLAYSTSEEVFFDRTMLALLYFPEEHKLAMYVPLFLPVFVPILKNIVRWIKERKAARAAAATPAS